MDELKKIIGAINTFVGVIFPCLLFIVLFLSFVFTIFARYLFGKSLVWGNEVAILTYIWIMFFGCGKAIENDEHAVFSLVYDEVPPIIKTAMLVLYNAILVVFMLICAKPCFKALLASTQITGVLKIPYTIAFAPFFWMMFNIFAYSIWNIRKAILNYKNPQPTAAAEATAEAEADKEVTV